MDEVKEKKPSAYERGAIYEIEEEEKKKRRIEEITPDDIEYADGLAGILAILTNKINELIRHHNEEHH